MSDMTIRYWGVRGSVPVPGMDTQRYGGNTSCVEVFTPTARVIVDGGTGLRQLGATLTPPGELNMFFTHLHWDHIQGIPFFGPVFNKDFTIHIYSGHKADVSLEAVLKGQMQAPNFPVELGQLPARLTFNEIPKGDSVHLPGLKVSTIRLNHPNEATGLRFETPSGKAFVHLTDHEHTPEFHESIVQFCTNADVLSMDTMFTPEDYPRFAGWGHSTWEHAVRIAREANVKRIVLFHHAPQYNDDKQDEIQAIVRKVFPDTDVAYEGMVIELG